MALPVWQATIQRDNGDIVPSAVITVIDESTGLAADLFSDRAGVTTLGTDGVFSATTEGFAQFYVAPGEYRITAEDSGTGFSQTWRFVPVWGPGTDIGSATIKSATDTQTTQGAIDSRVIARPSIASAKLLDTSGFDGKETIIISAPGVGGEFYWSTSSTATANDITVIKTDDVDVSDPGRLIRRTGQAYDIRWTGAVDGGSNNANMESICSLAAADGVNRVVVPFASLDVGSGSQADCSGCIVEGNDTTLTGDLVNTVAAPGFIINSRRSSYRAWHPSFEGDDTNKIIIKVSDNHYRIVARKETKGWILVDLKNNITTTFESLATTTSDLTAFRVTGVVNLVDAYVGYKAENASTGTWDDVNLITDILESFDSGIEYQYKQGQSGTAGIYYEMQIDVPSNGYFNVAFLRSSSSSTDVTISVDGIAVDANFDLSSPTAKVEVREYTAEPGTRLVRVTKNVSSGLVNLLGCNFFRLDQAIPYVSTDSYGYYISSTNYENYLSNTSANDYAIREDDLDTWGGSYHGGETNIVTDWVIGGNVLALSTGQSVLARKIELRQTFDIDWSGIGGPILSSVSRHTFIQGGYALELSFDGSITVESIFLTLYGISEQFTDVEAPSPVDISALPDETRAFYGRQNRYFVREPSTNQYIRISHSLYSDEENEKGGAYTYKVVGLYNKYYYAQVDRGRRAIDGVSAINVFKFG